MTKFKEGDKVQFIRESLLLASVVKDVKDCDSEVWYLVDDGIKDIWIFEGCLMYQTPLPEIPQFVADAIVMFKERDGDLAEAINYDTYSDETIRNLSLDRKMRGWLWESKNQETFARAWLNGYEIEKEPLYYVKLVDNDIGYLNTIEEYDTYFLGNNMELYEYKAKFTEQQIKSNDERYWAFAIPVEEMDGE